ncbi:11S globulin seed storage protein Ana o 2.0101 [Coffea arabica]|uniref:11S globulin seed storage protein Ana o 2.0101 n=1 Tax=Coffea arabica TaxID=13443 RepID=O82437_COFAR|nr:11S storage globulin [Coffea arabica]
MAHSHMISLSLYVLLFLGCLAQLGRPQPRLRGKTQCDIQKLNAQEPSFRFPSEAGLTEFWDSNNPEFGCAGVEFERNTVQPKGLRLPHYSNVPKFVYVVEGTGVQGTVIPGCAETFESQGESFWGGQEQPGKGQEGQEQGSKGGQEGRRQRFPDRHQKLRRFQKGDVLILLPGFTQWTYNDGDVPLVTVALLDVANEANQLDLQSRKFFLAGNPQQGGGKEGHQGQQQQHRNIFSGFDDQLLADAFNVDLKIIQKLKGPKDQRGSTVRAEKLQLFLPEYSEQEQQPQQQQEQQQHGVGRGWRSNGLEETLCTVKLSENIGLPQEADVFNPRAGRITTVNSQKIPILSSLQLSAERGFLYSNAIFAPHWNINAHSALYVIRGNARIQVVDHKGNKVFDDEVKQGQLIIVPQYFAVIKKAGNQGFEYVAFKTNDNAMINPLVGRLSAFRAIPEEVLRSSFQISSEEAEELKYGRQEALLLSEQSQQGKREVA